MKVHLLLRKEEINQEKIAENDKVAVVLDVLLATTTIVSALEHGAEAVIPVLDSHEAFTVSKTLNPEAFLLAGELHAKPLEGFYYPSPSLLADVVKNKTLILSTTNGTVALRKASSATKTYIASLANNQATARTLLEKHPASTVVVICSGNAGEVSLEDLYGAGHLIHSLYTHTPEPLQLSDAAQAAFYLYQGNKQDAYHVLLSSFVGQLFARHGLLDDLKFASIEGDAPVVAMQKDGKAVIEHVSRTTNLS